MVLCDGCGRVGILAETHVCRGPAVTDYECRRCGQVFAGKLSKRVHDCEGKRRRIWKAPTFPCVFCGVWFTRSGNLKRHVATTCEGVRLLKGEDGIRDSGSAFYI